MLLKLARRGCPLLLQNCLLHQYLLHRGPEPVVSLATAEAADVAEATVWLGGGRLCCHVLDEGVGSGGCLGKGLRSGLGRG